MAAALAARAGTDPELARRTARSMRAEWGPPPLPWPAALELERASQMWSMRRKDIAGGN
jgi:enoyl-CoA hydratase